MNLDPDALTQCVETLRGQLPELQAVYLFGSQADGHADAASDADLAVLLPVPLAATRRWMLVEPLVELLGRDVDLVDLRAVSTVMQYQILGYGQRLWSQGSDADEFELSALSEYWDLAILRRELLGDIKQRGSIHGR